ncbi:MAG: hypothetical protein ACLKAK_05855 [Alkaliphilus sp.]
MSFRKKKINRMLSKKVLKKSKIPILIDDDNWKKITGENSTIRLKMLSKKLKKATDEEKKIKLAIQNYKAEKQKLLKEILAFSGLINEEENEKVLDEISDKIDNSKERINSINEQLKRSYIALENAPMVVERINLDLLIETIKLSYKSLNKTHDKLEKSNLEIARVRKILDALREEKEIHENSANLYYTFLHGMLGHEEMEKLDIKLLHESNEENLE